MIISLKYLKHLLFPVILGEVIKGKAPVQKDIIKQVNSFRKLLWTDPWRAPCLLHFPSDWEEVSGGLGIGNMLWLHGLLDDYRPCTPALLLLGGPLDSYHSLEMVGTLAMASVLYCPSWRQGHLWVSPFPQDSSKFYC